MNNNSLVRPFAALVLALGLVISATPVSADAKKHGHGGGHANMKKIGMAGDAAKVTRTIKVVMHDNYYEPENISVKEGETVRFLIRNAGEFVHEFNIATGPMHVTHQPEMMMMVEHGVLEPDKINWEAAKAMQKSMGHGMHNEPNSKLLEPGKSGEIIWTFPKHADLEFACNIPGHYDSGMVGKVKLTH
ncbi:MAG: copper-binding protein [Rhodospirillaceae bacterium]|nr:copper-binding protein [Rhodospirillaceae bacterium]